MPLVQIDLRRGPARTPEAAESSGVAVPAASAASAVPAASADGKDGQPLAAAEQPAASDGLGRPAAGMVLAGGLIVLVPVATAATTSGSAAASLAGGLLLLGMLAILLRPALAEVAPP